MKVIITELPRRINQLIFKDAVYLNSLYYEKLENGKIREKGQSSKS